ncbi:DUF4249 domain-containing protein [Marinifilum sp. D714]|uniref:DUF4249 domain-containing protein n=1 Tax=Marinifilum sp. D714 TaxID=2937523 RepID=UPI0027C51B80|nr:DUF4249 domain-containing protein [Marinifilum sp. D714]MDQ2178385.1 DUF4249 domain-containing protein [Marinifilum sp. D714]
MQTKILIPFSSFANKQLKYICLLMFTIIFSSCTEEINVDVDSGETRLSVEAAVTSDLTKHHVILKETSDVFFNQDAIPVRSAKITVTDGNTIYNYQETKPGYYESEDAFAGKPGNTYSLSITNVDVNKDGTLEEYLASSTMKPTYLIDSIKMHFDPDYESYDEDVDKGPFWLVSLYMKDDIKTEDYYGFACRINDVMVHDTITEILVQKDTYFNGETSKGVDVGEFNQEKPDEILKDNDIITLETYAISEEYYDFVSQLQELDEGQNMFSGPPGNITSNISNGAIGFFAVYSITRTNIVHRDN